MGDPKVNRGKTFAESEDEEEVPVIPVARNVRIIDLRMTKEEFLRKENELVRRGEREPIIVNMSDSGTKWVSFAAYRMVLDGQL